jgi:nucleoside-diphosphate-sugar epimerase
VLGWTPAYGLDRGFERTVSWYSDYIGTRRQAHAA